MHFNEEGIDMATNEELTWEQISKGCLAALGMYVFFIGIPIAVATFAVVAVLKLAGVL